MFHRIFIDTIHSWCRWYKHHRKSHGCGIREAASWAWWNAWNPVINGGASTLPNSYISTEAVKKIEKREREWRETFTSCLFRERALEKKWKAFNDLKVETYLERVKCDNIAGMIELKKKLKKLEKTGKRKKMVDK